MSQERAGVLAAVLLLILIGIAVQPVSAGYSQIGSMVIPYGNNTTHGGASFTSFGDSFTVINSTAAYNYIRMMEYSGVYDVNDWGGIDHTASGHVDLVKTGSIKIGEGDMTYTLGDVDVHGQTLVNMILYNITLTAPPAADGFIGPQISGGGGDFVSAHRTNPFAITTWSPVTSSPSGDYNFYIYTGVPGSVATPGTYITYTDDYTTNVHVTVLENATSFDGTHHPIPRANVAVTLEYGSTASGQTDLFGNITFSSVAINRVFTPYINVSKAGYQETSMYPAWNVALADNYATVYMDDYFAPTGGQATVYVEPYDVDTGLAITEATAGIQNITSGVWDEITAPFGVPYINFNRTDGQTINLSVGQGVVFTARKTGAYVANHTGTIILSNPITHVSIPLKSTSRISPPNTTYFVPVVITDVKSNIAIGNSNLSVFVYGDSTHFNTTSLTGYFNVTGVGSNGVIPITLGTKLMLVASASGYRTGTLNIEVTNATNKVTQYIPLVALTDAPKSGEFAVIANVYDSQTTTAISAAKVVVKDIVTEVQTSQLTSATGTAMFQNLTAGHTYYIVVSKEGYSSNSNSHNGTSQEVYYRDFPLVRNGQITITPTVTPSVVTTAPTQSPDPARNADNAIGLLSKYLYTFMAMAIMIVFFTLFWMVVYALTGGKIITMILQRGRRGGR